MSKLANWTYVFDFTWWRFVPGDGYTQPDAWVWQGNGKCDYKSENKLVRNSTGDELTSKLIVMTEESGIKEGDYLALGVYADGDPLPNDKERVMAISRSSDLFYRQADDYEYYC